MPNGRIGRQSARAVSSDQMYFWVGVQPVPPSSFGQPGATQPFFASTLCQSRYSVLVSGRCSSCALRNSAG